MVSTCRFLTFFAILFLVHQNAVAMFRVFAALTRDMVVATSLGSLFLVIYLMLSGYILAKSAANRISSRNTVPGCTITLRFCLHAPGILPITDICHC